MKLGEGMSASEARSARETLGPRIASFGRVPGRRQPTGGHGGRKTDVRIVPDRLHNAGSKTRAQPRDVPARVRAERRKHDSGHDPQWSGRWWRAKALRACAANPNRVQNLSFRARENQDQRWLANCHHERTSDRIERSIFGSVHLHLKSHRIGFKTHHN